MTLWKCPPGLAGTPSALNDDSALSTSQRVTNSLLPQLDDEAEAEAYFSDLQARGQTSFAPPSFDKAQRPISPSGYLLRSGISDAAMGTKPEWIMPVVVQGGVWDMMKTLGRWKGEGWASLWKGASALSPAQQARLTRPILFQAS